MIKISYKPLYYLLLFAAVGLLFSACDSFTDSSKPFLKKNKVIYLAKSDSIQLLSGKERVVLKIAKPEDPLVTKAKILWIGSQGQQDSTQRKFSDSEEFLSLKIGGLQEGIYTFHIYTLDNKGDQSIGQTITGKVYGADYATSLLNRRIIAIKGIKTNAAQNIIITWDRADTSAGAIGSVVKYMNASERSDSVYVPVDSNKTHIKNMALGDSLLHYYTIYMPSAAIDKFHTDTGKASIPESDVVFDRSGWKIDDNGHHHAHPPSLLIDGNLSSFWNSATHGSKRSLPHSISVDMGSRNTLSGFKIVARPTPVPAGTNQNPRDITIQFSNDGENWQNGENFTLPLNKTITQTTISLSHPVNAQYFKITITSNVGNTDVSNLNEIYAF
jgi:hypothetical protein